METTEVEKEEHLNELSKYYHMGKELGGKDMISYEAKIKKIL